MIALSHVAVLTSNLLTGVLGFERYVRLKYLCNFRHKNWITNKNLNYYRVIIISFSLLFYAPKFFELKAEHVKTPCIEVVTDGQFLMAKLYAHLRDYKKMATNQNVEGNDTNSFG